MATAFKESETSFAGQLTDFQKIQKFIFAGNASITLVSKKTGVRFTYRIKQADDEQYGGKKEFWFVSLLNGQDNESNYQYFGHIFKSLDFVVGRNSKISATAPSVLAWRWFYKKFQRLDQTMFDDIEVWHEGRCGKCNRKLTVPSSIESGFGPECIKHV